MEDHKGSASITITAEASGCGIPESWTAAELRKALESAVDLFIEDVEHVALGELEEPEAPARLRLSAERPSGRLRREIVNARHKLETGRGRPLDNLDAALAEIDG